MKLCEKDDDPVLLVNGAPDTLGVLGAVAAAPGRREALVVSELVGENNELSGEGCVVDRWLIGAIDVRDVYETRFCIFTRCRTAIKSLPTRDYLQTRRPSMAPRTAPLPFR